MPADHWARCFGHDWQSDIALEHFDRADGPETSPWLSVSRVEGLRPTSIVTHIGRAEIHKSGFCFSWNDEASFDVQSSGHIEWVAGHRWNGQLPVSFYSSVAGLALAMRSMIPLHASSVVLNGKAWLIAGRAGMGKSTLVAELLSTGGKLLADDLTLVSSNLLEGEALAYRGRPAMRLHPATADQLANTQMMHVPDDPRGKLLVWPSARAADKSWPIAGALVLKGDGVGQMTATEATAIFGGMLFRPKICAKLPGQVERRRDLFDLARKVTVHRFPEVTGFDPAARQKRIELALQFMT
jgi:hypothetical protein